MTGFYIFLGIVCIILIILIIPVHIKFIYNEDVYLSIRYLFLNFKILPQKEKTEKQIKKEEKKQEKKQKRLNKKAEKKNKKKPEENQTQEKESTFKKFKNMLKEKGVENFFNLIFGILKAIKNATKGILNNIVIKKLNVKVSVGSEEPSETAISYGKMCSALFPAFAFIIENIKTKSYNIKILPDFEIKKINIDADVRLKVRPLILIGIAIKLIYRAIKSFIKFLISNKNQE